MKGDISWKGKSAEGVRREIYVKHVGNRWVFFVREKRFDQWQPLEQPQLEDWMDLLDAVRRRIPRRLVRPEEEGRVIKAIQEAFPGTAI